jgi:hypothetical protein
MPMPRRHSAEQRAGSFFRVGGQPIEPPRVLTTRAKRIWREIVTSKPMDWFDAGNAGLLADHCETQALLEEIWARLRRFPVGSKESAVLINQHRTVRNNYAVSARLLRLTVQQTTERQATKNAERGSVSDDLVGGVATHRRLRVAA